MSLYSMAFYMLFAVAVAVTVDVVAAFFAKDISGALLVAVFAGSAILFGFLRVSVAAILLVSIFLLSAGLVAAKLILRIFKKKAPYHPCPDNKAQLFAGKKVLIQVPHEDDEILVAGGVIEEYLKYGSEVYICFYTNGDFYVPAETRLTEALAVAKDLGIPEDHVIFLGYGDFLRNDKHICNLPDDMLVSGSTGKTLCHALDAHPPFRNSEYRRENIVSDIRDLILSILPDVIFCVDFDPHPDHAALALFFEEAMEAILKREHNDYFPLLLKSPCYSTAFMADPDFHGANLRSTVPPPTDYYPQRFAWEKRIRFPINAGGLSRSLYGCDTFRHLSLHASQRAVMKAEGVVNSDKVFWQRDTRSLSYSAKFTVSSGNASYLNDFKTAHIPDVINSPMSFGDCAWIPCKADSDKRIRVSLAEKSHIEYLRIFSNPAGNNKILNALISFDDGSHIETGELNRQGGSTVHIGKNDVKDFSVQLLSTEGEDAGISEIEIFDSHSSCDFKFIKLQNMQGDFMYDYYIHPKGSERFSVYSPCYSGGFVVSVDNKHCSANLNGGIITVDCPKGQSCTLTVVSEDEKYSDTAYISNPGVFMRYIGPNLEKHFRSFRHCNIRCSSTYRILHRIYKIIK